MDKAIEREIYFTPKQAAEYFNLSLSTVKNYIYAGKLKTLKTPGGHHRISKSELLNTLGSPAMIDKEGWDYSIGMILCEALAAIFKALGRVGRLWTTHARNVSALSQKVARGIGMDESEIRLIQMAGLLHDIGQIGIERHVLLKSGCLTPREYELVKGHPNTGRDILKAIKELKRIADIVVQHHERPDGRGYPRGLKGDSINKLARILSVAEAYDSMVSPYSYKKNISKDEAVQELLQNKGSQFDTEIVEFFTENI